MSEETKVPQRDAVRGFGDLIARVRLNREQFTITRFGRPVALLTPVPDDGAAPAAHAIGKAAQPVKRPEN